MGKITPNTSSSRSTMEKTLPSPFHVPPLPTLPFEVIAEILCRLPVKLLLQLRCICKSWNSLINDSKFAKKHLSSSTTRNLHCISYTVPGKYILKTYPLDSVFNNISTNVTQFEYSPNNFDKHYPCFGANCFIGSCNGILCIADDVKGLVILWNPSTRKFNEFSLSEIPRYSRRMSFGFGYDSFTDNYKVLVILQYLIPDRNGIYVDKTEVKVHTSSTNFWRSIEEIPFGFVSVKKSAKFVSGTINWLVSTVSLQESLPFILSFDLHKESYQKVLPPDHGGINVFNMILDVLRDCLCIISGDDVWVMKEYGIKESWTKLFTISNVRDSNIYILTKVMYSFDDDQVLLEYRRNWKSDLIVYDSKNGAFRFTMFQSNSPEICVESLISPCS